MNVIHCDSGNRRAEKGLANEKILRVRGVRYFWRVSRDKGTLTVFFFFLLDSIKAHKLKLSFLTLSGRSSLFSLFPRLSSRLTFCRFSAPFHQTRRNGSRPFRQRVYILYCHSNACYVTFNSSSHSVFGKVGLYCRTRNGNRNRNRGRT